MTVEQDTFQVQSPPDTQAITEDVFKLKQYLDENGIKYVWLMAQVGKKSRGWLSDVFKGRKVLTAKNKAKIEEILNIKL